MGRGCRVRHEGVPLRGHGPPRVRGGHVARRVDGGRAPRRPDAPGWPPSGWSSTATTSPPTSWRRPSGSASGGSSWIPSTRSTASKHSSPRARPPRCLRRCSCASLRASRCTPTSSSRPDRTTRSSGSASRPAPPIGPSSGWVTSTRRDCSSSPASTPISGARSSHSRRSPGRWRCSPGSSRRSAFRSWWSAAGSVCPT